MWHNTRTANGVFIYKVIRFIAPLHIRRVMLVLKIESFRMLLVKAQIVQSHSERIRWSLLSKRAFEFRSNALKLFLDI